MHTLSGQEGVDLNQCFPSRAHIDLQSRSDAIELSLGATDAKLSVHNVHICREKHDLKIDGWSILQLSGAFTPHGLHASVASMINRFFRKYSGV